MAIQKQYPNSNQLVADELAQRRYETGSQGGDFVVPDFPIPAELVDKVSFSEHKLTKNDIRAAGAPAKSIVFELPPSREEISVVEHAQKSTMDASEVENAGQFGITLETNRAEDHRNDILDLKEFNKAQLATSTANFSGTHKNAGSNFRTIDLIKYVDEKQEVIRIDGRVGNARRAALGYKTLRAIRRNDEFKKFAASSPATRGVLTSGSRQRTLEALADFLDLDEVRVMDFNRVFEGDLLPTYFWPSDFFLLFVSNNTLSNKTFASTAVVPYGQYHDVAEGTMVDVRTVKLVSTDPLIEIGAYHRYREYLCNANCAFLETAVVGHDD